MAETNDVKVSELFRQWKVVRSEMIDAVRPLTVEQLDWLPEGGKNSIGDLLRHISETEHWWFGDVVLGGGTYRDVTRDMAPDIDTIIKTLEHSFHEYTLKVLESHRVSDFESKYKIPGEDYQVTLLWVCQHVFEHECRHRGQILMMMRLQGMTPPNV